MGILTAIVILVLASVLYGVIEICKTLHKWHKQDIQTEGLPGAPNRHWLWGTDRGSEKQWRIVVNDLFKRCKAFKEWRGPMVVIQLIHPDTVKTFLARISKGNHFLHTIVGPWGRNGLFLSDGDIWRRNRKLLAPAFHINALRSYLDHFNAAVDIFIKNTERIPNNESTEICHPIHLLSFDILLRCLFSCHDDVQNGDSHPYVEAVTSLKNLCAARARNVLYRSDFLYYLTSSGKMFKSNVATVHTWEEDAIRTRRMTFEETVNVPSRHKLDFLDILLTVRDEEGMGLTDKEIRAEMDTFLFAGHDTTASAIPWILYCLAKHSSHQKLCQHEVDKLFVDRKTEEILWEDLSKIPYLTRCIKEGLRLYPPVTMALRVLQEPLQVEGITLPAGVSVNCNIHALHHNVNVWGEDCEEFKPNRFLPENMVGIDSHAFLAFLAGPRNCIGHKFAMNEIKTVVSRILRCFWLELCDTHDVEYVKRMTLTPVNGIKLRFVRRC